MIESVLPACVVVVFFLLSGIASVALRAHADPRRNVAVAYVPPPPY